MQATRSLTPSLLLGVLACACTLAVLPAQAGPGDAAPSGVSITRASDGGEPYALVRGRSDVITAEGADRARIGQLKRSVDGDFLWFRDGGKEYIVRDPAALQRLDEAWAPMEALGAQMGGQGAEMGRHGASMGVLGAKMALAAVTFSHDRMEAVGKQMEAAGKPMEAAGKKMEELGKQMEEQQRSAERATRAVIRDALQQGLAKPAPMRG